MPGDSSREIMNGGQFAAIVAVVALGVLLGFFGLLVVVAGGGF